MSDNKLKYPFLDLGKLTEPIMPQLEEAAVRVIRSGRYIGGEEVASVERKLSRIADVPHVVAVSSGFDALRLILRGYVAMGKLRPGDKVAVPANTFAATSLAVADAGLIPVFVEPDPDTFLIDFGKLASDSRIKDCRAVMGVDLYGRPLPGEDLRRLAEDRGWLIIEDAAQAIGAVSPSAGIGGGYNAGGLGHAGAFSFYPTKNAGALGDAGAVLTYDEELADTVRALANYGSHERYRHRLQGSNCRMDPIQAAMLSVRLDCLTNENSIRRRHAKLYNDLITNPDVSLPAYSDGAVWHQYVVKVDPGYRGRFRHRLAEAGVGTDIHYPIPCHLQACHAPLDGSAVPVLPVAERLAESIVSLPVSSATSDEDICAIAGIINSLD